jgi:aquaporin Z
MLHEIWRAPLAELVGTFFLTMAALVAGTPFAVALTLGVFVYVLGGISGSHLNPAVTIALAAARRMPAGMALLYLPAQIGGALLARLIAGHVTTLAHGSAAGTPAGEFLGFAFLMLAVIAVADHYVPSAGSDVAIGAALLAGLLVSKGILNPAIALAEGQERSAALWAPVLSGLVFTGIFLLLAPGTPRVAAEREQAEATENQPDEDDADQEDPPRPTPRLSA